VTSSFVILSAAKNLKKEIVLTMSIIITLIPLFPMLGALINGLFGNLLNRRLVGRIACGSVALSFIFSIVAFVRLLGLPHELRSFTINLYPWFSGVGDFNVPVGFLLDPLSCVMVLVVSGVGFLIHVYSIGYMREDPSYPRYFAYLNLFMFSMLILVLANNFLLMFVGWEAVGLCSYLLIGFWYEKKKASDAGKKAFIVNRIGDFGFILGILLIFVTFGTLNFDEVFRKSGELLINGGIIPTLITLLLFVGATGKSAQIPLYTWLPDAMEGPTPVSALIHAATMVTAGVYMVARTHVLFLLAPISMNVVVIIGLATAIYAASIGLVQNDIKRVLAYSTISQLGYMFLAVGLGAFSNGIFHLMTHAFFKALLFLGAGSVIHSLGGEQDMRKMGGLKKHMPVTYWTFVIAALAISGIIPFAGFFSKDAILFSAWEEGNPIIWALAVTAAFMTAFYIFRLVFLTFMGKPRVEPHALHHLHESPRIMTVPLIVLAGLSTIGGFVGISVIKGGNIFGSFLEGVFGGHHVEEVSHISLSFELLMMLFCMAVSAAGIGLAYLMYVKRPDLPGKVAWTFKAIYNILFNKYYVDELYDKLFVKPAWFGSLFLWKGVDVRVIDGAVNGVGNSAMGIGKALRTLQSGYTRRYAVYMVLGTVLIIGWIIWFR